MRLTTKHKTYVAVAGLAVIALLVDRIVLMPSAASAQTPRATVSGATAPEARPGSAGADVDAQRSPHAPRMSIAARLQAEATARNIDPMRSADAFAARGAWQAPTDVAESLGPAERAAERFLQAHTLNAVMTGTASGYAIIDGRFLYIGQSLDGFTLVSVNDRTAVLERDGTRVELSVPTRGEEDR